MAALLSTILMDIKPEAAMDVTNQSRHVEFNTHTKQQWNTRYEAWKDTGWTKFIRNIVAQVTSNELRATYDDPGQYQPSGG